MMMPPRSVRPTSAEPPLRALVDDARRHDLLASVSHEIRTPLTAILGYVELLLVDAESADVEERRSSLEIVQRNAHYLLELVNDLLDFSQYESGMMSIEPVEFGPRELLTDVAALMSIRAAAKQLNFSVVGGLTLPDRLVADSMRIKQILLNLIGNAVKFTDRGFVRLDVELRTIDGQNYLHCGVTDSGIGMTAEQLSRLFRPFEQVSTTARHRHGGNGLGLTLCRRLATMMHGEIGVESVPGEGSRFTLLLPVQLVGTPDDRGRAIAATHDPSPPAKPLAGRRVLLCEDGPDNRRLLERILQKAGADVATVDNGLDAVDAAWQATVDGLPFDCVLMDMQMPQLDGYEATLRLRWRGYVGTIVALTADALAGDRERCLDSGCDDYLAKPIDAAQLVQAVRVMAAAGRDRENGE
jgi:CheY-like chemotaxis protein